MCVILCDLYVFSPSVDVREWGVDKVSLYINCICLQYLDNQVTLTTILNFDLTVKLLDSS